MKTKITLGAIALLGLTLTSCNDFLDENRYPSTQEISNPAFWSNEALVEQECNTMYNFISGYGSGGTGGEFYFSTLSDDQAGNSFTNWKNTAVPSASTSYSTPYTRIRHAMAIVDGVRSSSLDPVKRNNFEGIARLNRAFQFWTLVKRYGDITWVSKKLDVADNDVVYGARTNRDIVMDSVLADLDYAIANISAQSGKLTWSKDLALAVKSDICLWEGTYCKYRTEAENGYAANEARAKKYLEACVDASSKLIDKYPVGKNYQSLYNSLSAGLAGNAEIIFYKAYDEVNLRHSTVSYTASSTKVNGITKDAFDAFLFTDGLPKSKTTLNTTDQPVKNEAGEWSIAHMLDVRDGRLSQITDPVVYYTDMTWVRSGSMAMTSSTGYGVCKFDNITLPASGRVNSAGNYTSAPLYWGALICLNYAEAKAELGNLTDGDLDKTLNKLYDRAGLPAQTVAKLTAINDPDNNMGVSSLIYEVRRCRRCELMMDKEYRYWDLIRWHKLDLLDNTTHPNILLGAKVTGAPVDILNVGGYVDATFGKVRKYEARQYLYPIPSGQIALNPNLEQNKLWK